MSIVDDLRRLWRGVIRTARSNLLYRENYRYGSDEVNLAGRDKVAVSMANQEFALVYPPSQPICSVDTTFNMTSWSNFVLALLASALTGASWIIFTFLLFSIVLVGTLSALGGFSTGLLPSLVVSNWLLIFASGAGALIAGFGLRTLDRSLTMVNCLKIAERKLRDPKVRHEETALLEWRESKSKIGVKIAELTENIRAGEKKVRKVQAMCAEILQMEHLSPIQSEADLQKHKTTIDKLSMMITEWKKLKLKFEDRIKTLEQRNQQMRVMAAALLDAGPVLVSVNNGTLSEEVQDLSNSIVELMDEIEKKNEYLHQDLLIESGLSEDDKKPPQIE